MQTWLANPGSNYGLLLQAAAATNTPNFEERFASREATDADQASQADHRLLRTGSIAHADPDTDGQPDDDGAYSYPDADVYPDTDRTATPSQSQQKVMQGGVNGYTGATDTTLDSWSPTPIPARIPCCICATTGAPPSRPTWRRCCASMSHLFPRKPR